MTVETLLLAVTTLIALVAVVAAVVAVRAVRELKAVSEPPVVEAPTSSSTVAIRPAGDDALMVQSSVELAPKVVHGRVVVPPTQAQVIRTALGRPGVRLNIFVHGLARALRPENRDRIVALMRREYRHRRRERLRAGRQAIRGTRPTSAPSTERLGVPPAATLDSRSGGSLTDRMVSS